MNTPEVLTNFRLYYDGAKDMMGVVDVTVPDIEPLNASIKGAGILGELTVPILGHVGALAMTINFRTISQDVNLFNMPVPHVIDLRGAMQVQDTASGVRKIKPVRISGQGSTKKTGLGKFAVGEGNDSSVELELSRFSLMIDGMESILIDKLNNIYTVNGVDCLSDVNKALGI